MHKVGQIDIIPTAVGVMLFSKAQKIHNKKRSARATACIAGMSACLPRHLAKMARVNSAVTCV